MNQQITKIPMTDPCYPMRLKRYTGMPDSLYVMGKLPDPNLPTVGIVGARLCDAYGKKTAYEFGNILASQGVQIISGMAIGVDSASHRGALDAKGLTYALLASGVDICYPSGSMSLYRQIARTGGIISEQPPGTPPLKAYFPQRNRIISALSDVVLVVEAKARSGSLITADFALDQGKSIFAVPGRIGDSLSDGCNRLIAQGAGIACSPEDILNELKEISRAHHLHPPGLGKNETPTMSLTTKKRVPESDTLSPNARQLYSLLSKYDPKTSDELCQQTGLNPAQVQPALVELELGGFIQPVGIHSYLQA